MNYSYSVSVIEKSTSKVVKGMEAIGLNRAEKIKRGLEINLNHSEYFVKITKQD